MENMEEISGESIVISYSWKHDLNILEKYQRLDA